MLIMAADGKQVEQVGNDPPRATPENMKNKKVSGVMSQCTYGMYRGELRFRAGNQGFHRAGESETRTWEDWMSW